MTAWVVLSVVIGYPVYLLTDRALPFVFVEGRIDPSTIRPLDTITITWTIRDIKRPECDGRVYRTFIDSVGTEHNMEPTPVLYGKVRTGNTFARDLQTPLGLAPGTAFYESRPYYTCNWLQKMIPWLAIRGNVSPRVPVNVLPRLPQVIQFNLPPRE
jgi:hypothetical protein